MGVFEVVGGAPAIAFGSSDTSFCDKNAIDFYDFSTNNPTTWQWTFTGAVPSTSTMQNPTGIYYPTYGQFDVKLVACNANGCDSLTITAFITEYQLPTAPVITYNNGWLTCSPANSYQWYLIPNAIPNATLQNYQPTQTGSYYCLISDSNGCVVASNTVLITNTAIPDSDLSDLLTITVNDGIFNMLFKDVATTPRVLVYNSIMQVVTTADVGQGRARIDMRNLEDGIYLIDVVAGNKHFVRKVWHQSGK
ncbi:MAG: PKD domain-containing protein [Bacteroidetes bacterium]|nr:PKD domain-containing protein [Bacteroidota bacterium]